MNIIKIPVGLLNANCYILEKGNKLLIIDPGDEYEKIKENINGKEILKILITHHHEDHIGALKYFDQDLILAPQEKTYNIGPFTFEVIQTKGHTQDSVTYYFPHENVMFTGDFLFKETIGRTDMETGSMEDMKKSLNKIKKYQNNIKIYPGHGPSTTLKQEKITNYFLNI